MSGIEEQLSKLRAAMGSADLKTFAPPSAPLPSPPSTMTTTTPRVDTPSFLSKYGKLMALGLLTALIVFVIVQKKKSAALKKQQVLQPSPPPRSENTMQNDPNFTRI